MNKNKVQSALSIFDYNDYKDLVRDWVGQQPKNGHGIYRSLAARLQLSPVVVSQIFSGPRELSEDHAFECAEFMQLNPLEAEYFLVLVQFHRASRPDYRQHLQKKLLIIKKDSSVLKSMIKPSNTMDTVAQARFY